MPEPLPSAPENTKAQPQAPAEARDTTKAKLESLKGELPNLEDQKKAEQLAAQLNSTPTLPASTATPDQPDPEDKSLLDKIKDFFDSFGDKFTAFLNGLFGSASSHGTDSTETASEWKEKVEHPDAPVFSVEKGVVEQVSSPYGKRLDPRAGHEGTIEDHMGVDIAMPVGTKLYATCSGKIVESHFSNGVGNITTFEREDGVRFRFLHLSQPSPEAGTPIHPGDLIGVSGTEGTGPHLHFEAFKDGQHVDPADYLPASFAEQAKHEQEENKAKVDAFHASHANS